MRTILAAAILVLTPFSGCGTLPKDKPYKKEPNCDTACHRMRELSCEISKDTPEGSSCEDICNYFAAQEIKEFQWDVSSLSEATSCPK